jgi:hypothetical protein
MGGIHPSAESAVGDGRGAPRRRRAEVDQVRAWTKAATETRILSREDASSLGPARVPRLSRSALPRSAIAVQFLWPPPCARDDAAGVGE